jgi:hypothetical protein
VAGRGSTLISARHCFFWIPVSEAVRRLRVS